MKNERTESLMKELFYFSMTKLLVEVDYIQDNNTIQYSTHRDIGLEEKRIIEEYILSKFAIKTDYYSMSPSNLKYAGKQTSLKRKLDIMRLRNVLKFMSVREKEAKEKVDELINSSLSNYYFEQIGDTILEIRKQLVNNTNQTVFTIEKSKNEIEELIKAYNNYSGKQISLEKVIPKDLIEYFN